MFKKKTLSIIGQGYVGFPLSLQAASKGFDIIAIENDARKIELINQKKSPLNDIITSSDQFERIFASSDFSLISDTEFILICVPTPVDDTHQPDLTILKNVVRLTGKQLRVGHIIISESTVNPGVADDIIIPLLEETSGLKEGVDFHLVHCPERINPGDPKWHVGNIPRVIGSNSKIGLDKSAKIYEQIIDAPIKKMGSIKEAEAVKIVENSFRDVNIAFVNELAMSFDKLGIDVVNVINGAATKPFAFMPHYPGSGVGGHCIPVDPYYLIKYAEEHDFEHKLLKRSRIINNGMPEYLVEKTISAQHKIDIKGNKIGLLGLSYKANVGDYRESPSMKIIDEFLERGREVITFDPHLLNMSTVKSIGELLEQVDTVVIATNHSEFLDLTPSTLEKAGVHLIIDGKNSLDRSKWVASKVSYVGIGVPSYFYDK